MKYELIIVEALKAVEQLNEEIYDYFEGFGLSFPLFDLKTDGFVIIIDFMGYLQLWNSDEDEREFYEEANEYESLEQYLRREAQEIINQISGIKL